MKKQWLGAINQYFPQWDISEKFLQTSQITVATYQELYSKRQEVGNYFTEQEIDFLVMDESHHLKKSWSELLIEARLAALQTTDTLAIIERKIWQ